MELEIGLNAKVHSTVDREDTAQEVGSGNLLVYATPCMVALMEGAACEAIAQATPDGKTTVGIALNISHVSATPVGLDVYAEAELTAIDKNILTFKVSAYDEAGLIGEGIHQRAIVTVQKFLEKTYGKL